MKEETIIFAITMLLCLTSVVSTKSGVASFYAGPYMPNACGHSENIPNIISVSDALWDNGNACGSSFGVWCKPVTSEGIFQAACKRDNAGNISAYVVTVVDYCGNCNGFTMLLSKEVFSAMTNTNDGNIQVEYIQFND